MGFDTMQERRALEKQLEEKKKQLRQKKAHDDWLADSVCPNLYKKYSRKEIDNSLVVFASDKSESLPSGMRSLFSKLTEEGFTCRFFSVPKAFRNRKAEQKWYEEFFSCFAVCKTLFLDDLFSPVYCIEPRKGQRIVQLWHTPALLRKAGYAIGKRGLVGEIVDHRQVHKNYTDVSVSSPHVKNTFASVFNCSEDIIHAWGCPRTDVYFDRDFVRFARESLIKMIPNLSSQIHGRGILLYAPTYRGDSEKNAYTHRMLDLLLLKRLLGEQYVFLVKMHPFIRDSVLMDDDVRDLVRDFAFEVPTNVPIETALSGSDMLITDYSTVLFDYALLNRPMIFYAFDFEHYTRRRPLFYDYKSFVPGPIVYDSAQLCEAVLDQAQNFDKDKMKRFAHKYMGGCDGHCTERVIHYAVKK